MARWFSFREYSELVDLYSSLQTTRKLILQQCFCSRILAMNMYLYVYVCVFIKLMEEVHRQAICCDLTSPLSLSKPLLFTRPQPSLPLSKHTCMSDNVRNLIFPYLSDVKNHIFGLNHICYVPKLMLQHSQPLYTVFSTVERQERN